MLSSGGQCFFDGRFSASSPIGHVLVKAGGAGDKLGNYFVVNDANMAKVDRSNLEKRQNLLKSNTKISKSQVIFAQRQYR